MVIKSIDVFSAGKMMGIIMAAFGLLAGLLFFLFGSMFGAALGQQGGGMAMLGGAIGVVVMPFLYGIFGFIGGVIQAFSTTLLRASSVASTSKPSKATAPAVLAGWVS